MTLRREDFQAALWSQSACNLSGVVFSFARVMQRICDEANATNKGTDWKNQHAICRLFAEQINHLTRARSYDDAAETCEVAVKELDVSS